MPRYNVVIEATDRISGYLETYCITVPGATAAQAKLFAINIAERESAEVLQLMDSGQPHQVNISAFTLQ